MRSSSEQKIESPRERELSKVINIMDAIRRTVETERADGERPRSLPSAVRCFGSRREAGIGAKQIALY
jgi:hypothetical protein